MSYPNLTTEEISAIKQFVKFYRDEIGYNEVLHGGERSIQPEIPQNQIFYIDALRQPDHPQSKRENYIRILSKMNPDKAKLLESIIRSMHANHPQYRSSDYDVYPPENRKKKLVKPKVKKVIKKCKCKK